MASPLGAGHADDEDAVVELGAAGRRVVQHAGLVVLEVRVVGLDGDGDRPAHRGRRELRLVVGLDVGLHPIATLEKTATEYVTDLV
jgi:hypothetical protein